MLSQKLAERGKQAGTSPAAESAPAEAVEGEGFRIDLQWLSESKKALKWSDDTFKTFLVSEFKVSPQGTLNDVIKRLTREQAEEFVKKVNGFVEKQQQPLFPD